MYKYGAKFIKDTTKPFIKIDTLGRVPVLIDTGADINMWSGPEDTLKIMGAKDTGETLSFTSPSGVSSGKLYMIDNLHIGCFIYSKFPILHRYEPTEVGRLLLASSVLYNTKCMFDFTKQLFGMAADKSNLTVFIKKEHIAMEFTDADTIDTVVVYKYKTVSCPMEYKNTSIQTLVESVQSRIHFLEDTYQTTVKIQCDFATKRKLLEVVPYTYFYDK